MSVIPLDSIDLYVFKVVIFLLSKEGNFERRWESIDSCGFSELFFWKSLRLSVFGADFVRMCFYDFLWDNRIWFLCEEIISIERAECG